MIEGRVTPVSNALFDVWLPRLKDTELRVYLVVWRATKGWTAGRGRTKTRDWISSGQMQKRTGRSSEAVSAAIASLVSRGLLVVEDAAGRRLLTPEERRRHLGMLYFRAVDMWITGDECRPGKPKRTKDRDNKKEADRSTA